MGKVVTKVTELLEPICAELGYELVDVEYEKQGGRTILRLLVDKPGGITLTDCETVSRVADPVLDAADPIPGAYFLEVSSPGLERPLKKPADFERFAGHEIALRLHGPIAGRRSFQGTLKGWRDGAVVLEIKDGPEQVELEIPFTQVSKAHLVAEF